MDSETKYKGRRKHGQKRNCDQHSVGDKTDRVGGTEWFTYAQPKVHGVDRIQLCLGIQRVVEFKGGLYRFWVILLLFEKVDHLEGFANVWNLFFEAPATLGGVELHEFVLGHGLLELFQCRLDLFIGSTEIFLNVGL